MGISHDLNHKGHEGHKEKNASMFLVKNSSATVTAVRLTPSPTGRRNSLLLRLVLRHVPRCLKRLLLVHCHRNQLCIYEVTGFQ